MADLVDLILDILNGELSAGIEAIEGERNAAQQIVALINPDTKKLLEQVEGAKMARTRLDDFADRANAGTVHHDPREWKRKIWAAFADFDAAIR